MYSDLVSLGQNGRGDGFPRLLPSRAVTLSALLPARTRLSRDSSSTGGTGSLKVSSCFVAVPRRRKPVLLRFALGRLRPGNPPTNPCNPSKVSKCSQVYFHTALPLPLGGVDFPLA